MAVVTQVRWSRWMMVVVVEIVELARVMVPANAAHAALLVSN